LHFTRITGLRIRKRADRSLPAKPELSKQRRKHEANDPQIPATASATPQDFFRFFARRFISADRCSGVRASQYARDARLAISLRRSGVIVSARRFPPSFPAFRVSIAADSSRLQACHYGFALD